MKLKIGDNVLVLLGKDKNRQGAVVNLIPKSKKAIVKDINVSKRHVKSSQNQPGGIIDKEMPIHISKLALICPSCHKPTRVGFTVDKDGTKNRLCKKCRSIIDQKKVLKKVTAKKSSKK